MECLDHGSGWVSQRVLVESELPPPTPALIHLAKEKERLREAEWPRSESLRLRGGGYLVQLGELDPLLQGAAPADGRDVQHAIPELDEGSAGGTGAGRRTALNSNPAPSGTSASLDLRWDKNPHSDKLGPQRLPVASRRPGPVLPQA